MKVESPAPSIDLKTAAFKALLQGPLVFSQFSCRFSVSENEMQEWLDDAGANLALVPEQPRRDGKEAKKCSSPLVCEERKILLGNDAH